MVIEFQRKIRRIRQANHDGLYYISIPKFLVDRHKLKAGAGVNVKIEVEPDES